MSYFVWLPVVALVGWASGKIMGGEGLGRVADILLGISGAFLARFIIEQTVVPLEYVYLALFSIWGAAAPPAIVRLLTRRHSHSESQSRRTTIPFER